MSSKIGEGGGVLVHSYEALSHDLVSFTIGLNFFPRSSLVPNRNGKGKAGGEVDTSPIECVRHDPSKGGRDKEILQIKGGIKASIGQITDKGEEIKLHRRGRDRTTSHGSKVGNPYIQR